MTAIIQTDNLSVGYDKKIICNDVSLTIEEKKFTAIIGPNACGKSTLLRSIARILPAAQGTVLLDGKDIANMRAKELARQLGLLPQHSIAPEGIRVADLVARGRYPHQRAFDRWSVGDENIVRSALEATGTIDLSGRLVDELSGGATATCVVVDGARSRNPSASSRRAYVFP